MGIAIGVLLHVLRHLISGKCLNTFETFLMFYVFAKQFLETNICVIRIRLFRRNLTKHKSLKYRRSTWLQSLLSTKLDGTHLMKDECKTAVSPWFTDRTTYFCNLLQRALKSSEIPVTEHQFVKTPIRNEPYPMGKRKIVALGLWLC